MKPQIVSWERSTGDTDQLEAVLSTVDGDTATPLSDLATVTLVVAAAPDREVVGTAKGDGSGTFYFDTATLADLAGEFQYYLQAAVGSELFTVVRGRLYQPDPGLPG